MNSSINKQDKISYIKGQRIFLYGAGKTGKAIYKLLMECNISIIAFLDKNVKSDKINNIDVINPFEKEIEKNDAIVIVTVFNRDVDFIALKSEIINIGFTQVFSFIEIFSHIAGSSANLYWLSKDISFLSEKNVDKVRNLLYDNISIRIFDTIIESRKQGIYPDIKDKSPVEEQYFSKNLPLRQYDNFIDCGAFDGDTIEAMNKMNIFVENVYAFEPDLENFEKLVKKIKLLNQKIICFPFGVYNANAYSQFDSGEGEGSRIVQYNTIQYNTIQYNTIQYNTIQYNTIQYNTIQYKQRN